MSEMNPGVDRRRFIQGAGVAILTVACASGDSRGDGNQAAENLIIHSGPGKVPHTHDLLIPYAVLNVPPLQGVKLESTRALFHTHDVVLSQEQLILVKQGGTVTEIGGSHLFVIALAPAKEKL